MQLFYREYGSGNPFILLHGLYGCSDNWVGFARKLASECNLRVIVPDLRNHGQSPHDPLFTFEAMVGDLFELIGLLNIEKPIVMGHSLGGKIILHALLQQRDFCQKAIIADMGLRTYPPNFGHAEVLELMQNHDLSECKSRKEVEALVSTHIPDSRLQQLVLKNVYWKNPETLAWKLDAKAIGNHLSEVFNGITYSQPIEVPTIFIKAMQSGYINEEDRALIEANFTNAIVLEVPEAGHWLHVDNPEGFFSSVKTMVG
jgi:pimeloyl-ACP methyl ester carboxylesterase